MVSIKNFTKNADTVKVSI